MRRMRSLAGRAWVAPMAALFFTTGVVRPLLETERPGDGPVLETHHQPGDCARGHDHSLCTVIDGGFSLPAPPQARHASRAASVHAALPHRPSLPVPPLREGLAARPPPAA